MRNLFDFLHGFSMRAENFDDGVVAVDVRIIPRRLLNILHSVEIVNFIESLG